MANYCVSCGSALNADSRFCPSCGRPLAAEPSASESTVGPAKKVRRVLMRPRTGRKIAGVCQGLANHMDWDVTLLRVVTVLLAFVTFPLGIIAYLTLWLVMPEGPVAALPPATHAGSMS